MASLYLVLVGACMAWLGYRLATHYLENKRLAALVEHQKKTVAALLKAADGEKENAEKIRNIENADPDNLTDLYNDIVK